MMNFEFLFSNIKLIEKAILGIQGSYVELLTIFSLGLLAIIPVIVPQKHRQIYRHLNQIFGIFIFVFVVFTCLGVFGMVRNFIRGLSEIGKENVIALYYCSVPVTVLITSMIFGPAFCGWICPTGTLQEFAGFLTKKWKKSSGNQLIAATIILFIFLFWMWHLSVTRMFFVEDASIYWSEILVILLFILAFKIEIWDKKLRRLRKLSFIIIFGSALLSIRITSPVHFGFAKVYDPASFLSTVMVVLAAMVVPHVWCKYLCPWRCVIAWSAKHSVRKIKFDESKCIKCKKCDEVCGVDAVNLGKINDDECHFCFKCVDKCPEGCFRVKDSWG